MSGGELIQPLATSAGAGPLSGSFEVSTGPDIDDGFRSRRDQHTRQREDRDDGADDEVRPPAPRPLRLQLGAGFVVLPPGVATGGF